MQLNRVLKLLGLRLVLRRDSKSGGIKTRWYGIDVDGLNAALSIVDARRAIGGWDFLHKIHGWQDRDIELDVTRWLEEIGSGQDDL